MTSLLLKEEKEKRIAEIRVKTAGRLVVKYCKQDSQLVSAGAVAGACVWANPMSCRLRTHSTQLADRETMEGNGSLYRVCK
jgi:hypothetical protein